MATKFQTSADLGSLSADSTPPHDGGAGLSDVDIGRQIRDLRKARRITITELASRIERSVGYVSQIERGLSAVSITVLQQIAGALDVQVSWFFQGNAAAPKEERDVIVRRGNRRRFHFGGSGVTEELLSPNLSGQIELILTRFEPGGHTGDEGRLRSGEEAGYLMSGSLEIVTDTVTYRLEAGDSFAFREVGRHRCHNPGAEDAVVLWIHSPPSY